MEEAPGERIGELNLDLHKPALKDGVIWYDAEVEVDGEVSKFDLARYHTHLGWIETFGLPPFNEWVVLDDFEQLEADFSGELNGEDYTEEVGLKGTGEGSRIEITRETETGDRETILVEEKPGDDADERADYSSEHTGGGYTARQKRFLATDREELDELSDRLSGDEHEYAEKVIEKEGFPTVVILKVTVLEGTTPPVYRKMFPFWETTEFDRDIVRSIELGYLDRGDSGTEIDSLHGEWYKLFTLENFDHEKLEIREGNWQSTEVEIDGEKKTTKQHYEKHLYRYED